MYLNIQNFWFADRQLTIKQNPASVAVAHPSNKKIDIWGGGENEILGRGGYTYT